MVETIRTFLNTHGVKHGLRRVRTDQDGELAKSSSFRTMIEMSGYTLETTAAGDSFQDVSEEGDHHFLT